MMKETREMPDALESDLLLLPDGTVLANRLTPSMAALLARIDLYPDPGYQSHLTGKRELGDRPDSSGHCPVRGSAFKRSRGEEVRQPHQRQTPDNQHTLSAGRARMLPDEPGDGLGGPVRVSLPESTNAGTQRQTGEAR